MRRPAMISQVAAIGAVVATCCVARAQLSLEEINARLETVYSAGEMLSVDESAALGASASQLGRQAKTPGELAPVITAIFDIASLSEVEPATAIRSHAHALTPKIIASGLSEWDIWAFLWSNYRRPRVWMSEMRRQAEAPELRTAVRRMRETAPTDRTRAMLMRFEMEQWIVLARDSSLGTFTMDDKQSAAATHDGLLSEFGDTTATQHDQTYREVTAGYLDEIQDLSVGAVMPDFEGEDLYGRPIRLSDLRGNVVLLSGWADWCLPCRAMFPDEIALVNELRDESFVFLGVNDDRDRDAAIALAEKAGLNYASIWSDSATPTVTQTLHMSSLPAFFVLDAEGRIIARALSGGENTAEYLRRVVLEALDELKKSE